MSSDWFEGFVKSLSGQFFILEVPVPCFPSLKMKSSIRESAVKGFKGLVEGICDETLKRSVGHGRQD